MPASPAMASVPGQLSTRQAIRRIAGRFRPYRWQLLASMGVAITAVALSMTWPLLLKQVINEALPRHQTGLLAILCLAMIAAGAGSTLLLLAQGAMANVLGQAVVHDLRTDVYAHVQSLPVESFPAESNSMIQSLMTSDIGGISDLITFSAQGAVAAAINLLAASLVMLILSWPLALASLLLAGLLNTANARFSRKRNRLAHIRQEKVAQLLQAVSEDLALPGVLLGRTLGRSAAQREKFTTISADIARLTRSQRLAGGSARALIGITLVCLPPVIYWLSGTLVPGLTLGAVVVLATMQIRLSSPIQQLLSLNGEFQASLAMFERVFTYLDSAPPTVPPDRGSQPRHAAGPVTLRATQISFRYPAAGRNALTGVSLTLQPGTTTVIAGGSGSGKSTLALILSGLMAPASGLLELNGRPASPAVLRGAVTLIAQDGAIFNASLRDNLLFAKPDATEAELRRAVEAAGLSELLGSLGDGLDSMVGERGYQLSGGERQRVSVARALLVRSPVLVADEATSALDASLADAVHQALQDRTRVGALVVVAHRIPPLAPDDQVILLDAGRIASSGRHAVLLDSSMAYARMHNRQPTDQAAAS